jgi:hypothetical protein
VTNPPASRHLQIGLQRNLEPGDDAPPGIFPSGFSLDLYPAKRRLFGKETGIDSDDP